MNQKIMRMLCAAVLAAGLMLASGCGVGSGTMTVKAYLGDSAGLFVGNDVGVLGVPVGKVTAITPVGDQVEVTMQVDTDQPIPANAWADVVSRSVATDRYVELAPVYKPGEPKMTDGGQIPESRTQTPVDFDEVLAALNTFATGIGGSKTTTAAIRHFLNAGTQALSGRGPLLNQTIHSLANGINSLAAQRGNVSATLTSLDNLVGTIAANQGTAKQFIRQVSAASSLLAAERVNFRSALRSLSKAVQTVAKFAVDNRAELVKLLGGSSQVMKTVLSRQKQLAEILRVMPLALQNLARLQGNRLPVRIDPLILDPLGGVLQNICAQLPGNLCDILDGIQPGAN
ncbi:MAG TPA: MCE family protein [Nocardioides sp.]|nr:MCE family protein [Nocardioides sp.]